jgi:hypothetical protein
LVMTSIVAIMRFVLELSPCRGMPGSPILIATGHSRFGNQVGTSPWRRTCCFPTRRARRQDPEP